MIILTDSFDGTKNKLFTYKKNNPETPIFASWALLFWKQVWTTSPKINTNLVLCQECLCLKFRRICQLEVKLAQRSHCNLSTSTKVNTQKPLCLQTDRQQRQQSHTIIRRNKSWDLKHLNCV